MILQHIIILIFEVPEDIFIALSRRAATSMAGFKAAPPHDERVLDQNSEDFQRTDPNSGVRRGLKTRHLSMLALAGSYSRTAQP